MPEFKCGWCGGTVTPGAAGVTYDGRTGKVACADDNERTGVPLTEHLAAGLTGDREWTQADEDHVTGNRYV